MASIVHFFVSFDSFGEAVSLNYKGEGSYKTALGALVSIGLKSFILTSTLLWLVDLFQYKDPQITQVSDQLDSNAFG